MTGVQHPPHPAAAPPAYGHPPRGPRRRVALWVGLGVGALVLLVVAAVAVTVGLRYLTGDGRYTVAGESMQPTLKRGATFTVKDVSGGKYEARRGDIVVFRPAADWTADRRSLVLRVIATPGETVSGDSAGHVSINGRPLDEPYAHDAGGSRPPFAVQVPAGRVWLMGDNRAAASDSSVAYLRTRDAAKATVATDDVTGVVMT